MFSITTDIHKAHTVYVPVYVTDKHYPLFFSGIEIRKIFSVTFVQCVIIALDQNKHFLSSLSPVFGHQCGGGHRGDGRGPWSDLRPAGRPLAAP